MIERLDEQLQYIVKLWRDKQLRKRILFYKKKNLDEQEGEEGN